jgi:N-acyl-D-aspartate/D-glutamate deacylase
MAREGLLPLEAMVRKMTALPARRFGLGDRGTIAVGAFADLVMFDPATVRDKATFNAPHAYPDGLSCVVVNGTLAWEPGTASITRAGRALRR